MRDEIAEVVDAACVAACGHAVGSSEQDGAYMYADRIRAIFREQVKGVANPYDDGTEDHGAAAHSYQRCQQDVMKMLEGR